MLFEFTLDQVIFTALIFVWTGFVRSGLGFGGAALGLPLMLFVHDQPLYWLPIIGTHLLLFTSLTLRTRLNGVNWAYLRQSLLFIVPAALVGVMGLLTLPNEWLVLFIYVVTFVYALIWLMNWALISNSAWLDRVFLVTGGYIAGVSLTGAPLMVAVYMRNVPRDQLRNTLFVLWFLLVLIKMSAFAALGVDLQTLSALLLLPVAAIGHVVGLKFHDRILENDQQFRRIIGGVLIVISAMGLFDAVTSP